MKGLEQDPEGGLHVIIYRWGGVGGVALGVDLELSCLGIANWTGRPS